MRIVLRHSLHLAIIACWVVFACVWLIASFNTKAAKRRQSSASRAVHVALEVVAFFLLFDEDTAIGPLGWRFLPHSLSSAIAGLAITVTGILFAIWARFYLGTNWSAAVTVKQDHELVRSGPYKWVRHPIYTGICFAFLGTAIDIGEVRALVGLILAATGYKLKSLTEESLMEEQFGTEYGRYKREVKGLIPFVW
ncbi:MAG: isoprenylcysteine carboxylmethyltransferase family protein [Acidobacteriaceae bacterium]|nr:isoprenylcysteine carboxylmethyltransferase family protein [Acidobacteriaceae bacterium]